MFLVTMPIPNQSQSYAQSESGEEGEKEPTLKDLYKLLKEIQTKMEQKERGLQGEVDGYLTGIKITKWSLYVAWGVPTIHNITIENTSDRAYKDIKIRAHYYYSYSTEFGRSETGEVEGVIPVTLAPNSKETSNKVVILKQGSMASMYGGARNIEVIAATPLGEYEKDLFTSK
jgi:hypothetical protein